MTFAGRSMFVMIRRNSKPRLRGQAMRPRVGSGGFSRCQGDGGPGLRKAR